MESIRLFVLKPLLLDAFYAALIFLGTIMEKQSLL